jgi:hypothetical protein
MNELLNELSKWGTTLGIRQEIAGVVVQIKADKSDDGMWFSSDVVIKSDDGEEHTASILTADLQERGIDEGVRVVLNQLNSPLAILRHLAGVDLQIEPMNGISSTASRVRQS